MTTGMNESDRADFWNGVEAGSTGSEQPPQDTGGSFVKSLLVDILIAAVLAGCVLYFIRPTIVKQTSMEDTLHENDYMIMARQAYKRKGPERGDIIVFRSELINEENGSHKLLIKRVIGLPGDEISIKDNQLYINGEAYKEDYLKDGYTPAFEVPAEGETYTVPEDSYFCMGDNRVGSVDSRRREVGCPVSDQIVGKVIVRLYPFNKIQRF
jgi:signal peptidase I